MTDTSIEKLTELVEKYKWQVRDTCTRAEAAERERDALREALQQIANSNGPRAAEYRSIARAALEAKP